MKLNAAATSLLQLPIRPTLNQYTQLLGADQWLQLRQLEPGQSKLLPFASSSDSPDRWLLWTAAQQDGLLIWQISDQTALGRTTLHWQHQSQLAAVGQVMAGICHEVNQPLNAMRLRLYGLQAMQKNGPIDDLASHLTALDEQVGRCADTLTNMREMVGHQSVNLTTFNACKSVEHVVNLLKSQLQIQQVQISSHNTGQQQLVYGQAQRLEQVLINLINNARDALIGQVQPAPQVKITVSHMLSQGNAGINISVADNGPGIDLALQEQVFEAYYTSKADTQGTGLGLALCRDLSQDLGGYLKLTSSPGATVFNLWLPLAADPTQP
jgi:C4-dicarboxylate-specific signal transduction histidine kinase